MRSVSLSQLITLSIERTKAMLFEPFALKKWIKLICIAFLAGALTGGGFSGWGGDGEGHKTDVKKDQQVSTVNQKKNSETSPPQLSSQEFIHKNVEEFRTKLKGMTPEMRQMMIGVWVLFAILFAGVFLVILWISSRFKFVWLNSVIEDSTEIRKPFRMFRRPGNSLFKINLIALLVGCLLAGVILFLLVHVFQSGGSSELIKPMFISFLSVALFFMLLAAGMFWVGLFVMPIMMIDQLNFSMAWRRACDVCRGIYGDVGKFLLLSVAVGFVCAILEGLTMIAVFVALGILAAVLYGAGYLLFYILLKSKILLIGFSVGVGMPLAAVFIFLMMGIMLPFAVFYQNLSLMYLSSLNRGYTPVRLESTKKDGHS